MPPARSSETTEPALKRASDERDKRADQRRAGEGADLTSLKQLIIERTDSTPFFMEEMMHSLFEEGVLTRNGKVRLAKSISMI